MSAYVIYVPGCDDVTEVVMDLTDDQFQTVAQVAAVITQAGGGCAPTMSVRPATAADLEPKE